MSENRDDAADALSGTGSALNRPPRLARIASIDEITGTEKAFRVIQEEGEPLGHSPGQFVQVSVSGVGEAAVSICTSPTEGPEFGFCVSRVGALETYLHSMKAGDWFGVRGPFGHGFPMEAAEGMDLLFVAGGIGLAPLRSAIRYALDRRDHYRDITVLHAARTPGELLFHQDVVSWLERDDVRVLTTVDIPDGQWAGRAEFLRPDERTIGGRWVWDGRVGVITTLFPDLEVDAGRTVAMVVGPPVMYRFVLLELLGKDIPEKQIVFSLEHRMKCGVGECGHCQIDGTCICQDGPVFSYPRLKHLW